MEMTYPVTSSVRPSSEVTEREIIQLFLDALQSGALLIDTEGKITAARVATSGLSCRSVRRAIRKFTRMPNRSLMSSPLLRESERLTFRSTELAC